MRTEVVVRPMHNFKCDDIGSASLPFCHTHIRNLIGVGPTNEKRLSRLGITNIKDLLFHLPVRYEDRTKITPISILHPGDQALIEVEVQHEEIRIGRRRSLLVVVTDGSGTLLLRFFTFSPLQRESFKPGVRLRCYGEVRQGPNSLELVHPEYHQISTLQPAEIENTLTPIYSTTEGLHQFTWRSMIKQALEILEAHPNRIPELLPKELALGSPALTLLEALRTLHRPPSSIDLDAINQLRHPAQLRLAFEELLAHQISLRRLRLDHRHTQAPILKGDGELRRQFVERLPFNFTTAQQRVITEIALDLAANQPMLRLLQGDVGAGKTVVAVMTALQALEAGYQVAIMVPTELLAEQHVHSIRNWLEPLGVEVAWLKKQKDKERERILESLARGQAMLVVGTHALIQADITFALLGLIIIDEQHRFGVHQRLALREKGINDGYVPHQLVMTATPIPRSLAMTAYADLDISVLDQQPPGRTQIITAVMPDNRRDEVIARVKAACAAGRQVYWICTLIEESGSLQCQAAEDTAALLREVLTDIRVGLIHGRMKSVDREAVMNAFKDGNISLLVATTVIEVGMDVPNASLIIIENPERLGLAQLHQLRGRVGRGRTESHCLLLYHAPLPPQASERLRIIRANNDGFDIARQDLALRGPGELLGTLQAGEIQFRFANLTIHEDLITPAQQTADQMLKYWPDTSKELEECWQIERHNDGLLT